MAYSSAGFHDKSWVVSESIFLGIVAMGYDSTILSRGRVMVSRPMLTQGRTAGLFPRDKSFPSQLIITPLILACVVLDLS